MKRRVLAPILVLMATISVQARFMRNMRKILPLVVLFVAALMASAQSPAPVLHVTAVRDWAPTDPAPVSRVKCYIITGTVGSIRYAAEQLFTWGSQRFQVGADYPVTVDGQALKVRMTDKKGHEVPERLNVVSVEEMDSTRKP
jgi:hypothetical protein